MIRLARWAGSTIGSVLAVYTFFFVPIGGTRTLWEHACRIARTPEAQDLGHDVDRAGRAAAQRIAHEALLPMPGSNDDAGVPKLRASVLEPVPARARPVPGAHLPR